MQVERLIFTLTFVLASFLATSLTTISETLLEQKNSIERAKELWEMAIAAKGGRDKLHTVDSLAITTDASNNSRLSLTLYAFPSKYWDWSDYRPSRLGLQVTMENHELGIGYFVVGHQPDNPSTIKLSEESLSKFADMQLMYLMETKWFKPEFLGASKSRIGQQRVDVVEIKSGGFKVGVFLDEKTRLPIQLVYYSAYKPDKILDRIELSDYRNIAGIPIPHSINVGADKWVKVKVEVNVKYNPRVFEHPPDISAGSEQWRVAEPTPPPKKPST